MLKIELDRREATERQQQECLCKQKRKQNKQISKAIKKKRPNIIEPFIGLTETHNDE